MKVYKIGEKKNPGIVIVRIEDRINDRTHEALKELSKFSDIAFIFPESSRKIMNPRKASGLYGATFYYVTPKDFVNSSWDIIDYLEGLYDYFSISLITGNLFDSDLENLERLQVSLIESSIFSSRDLTSLELQEIYMIPEKKSVWKFWHKTDDSGIYSRRITKDPILFFRPITIRSIREYLERHQDYLETFREAEVFYPSVIETLGGSNYLNSKVNETRI